MKKQCQKRSVATSFAVRYWLVWAMLLAAIAYGFHCYFEYRDAQLEKRLERLK
ncbi:MAG: hypothetical protein IPM82_22365 [Saprospiraceae bacterium]|nr:hypothetical protein [Saprospiraceae bacterium]